MTEPTQDPRGIERLALLAIVLALLAVPFIGLVFSAPWYWYPASAAYLYWVSDADSVTMKITSVVGQCWRAARWAAWRYRR